MSVSKRGLRVPAPEREQTVVIGLHRQRLVAAQGPEIWVVFAQRQQRRNDFLFRTTVVRQRALARGVIHGPAIVRIHETEVGKFAALVKVRHAGKGIFEHGLDKGIRGRLRINCS